MSEPYGTETGIFQNKVNTMAADALAPYVAKTSAAMVLTMQGKQVIAFYDGFYLPVSLKFWEIIDRLLSARLQYLQCVSNGDTAVLHWTIEIFLIYFYKS